MIWGGGVAAKKLIGCTANEDAVIVEGYQRPRKIVQSRRGGIPTKWAQRDNIFVFQELSPVLDPSSFGWFVYLWFDYLHWNFVFPHNFTSRTSEGSNIQLLKFLVSFQKTAIRLLARASVLRSTLQCRPWMAPIKWSTRTAFRRAVSHQDSGNPEAGWWTCTWAARRRMNGHICIEAIRQTVEDQLKFPEFCWWTIFSGREGRRMFPRSVCVWEKWGFCTRRRLGRIWKGMDAKGKRRII